MSRNGEIVGVRVEIDSRTPGVFMVSGSAHIVGKQVALGHMRLGLTRALAKHLGVNIDPYTDRWSAYSDVVRGSVVVFHDHAGTWVEIRDVRAVDDFSETARKVYELLRTVAREAIGYDGLDGWTANQILKMKEVCDEAK